METEGELLLLHRQDDKSEGNKWCAPGGKVKAGETLEQALIREIQEETCVNLATQQFRYFDAVHVRYPEYDFIYHMFHARFDQKPEVFINTGEHKDYKWVGPKDALKMDLLRDGDSCIQLFYNL